ncbi:MAG: PIN domain-containing protein [Desulfobulbaceae bacterium]
MRRYVFDSFALLAFLEDEPGAEIVAEALQEIVAKKASGYLSVINWGEIYYSIMRELGQSEAESALSLISGLPLELVDADLELTRAAARPKGRYRIAYADCFASALAKKGRSGVCTAEKGSGGEVNQINSALHEQ